MSYFESIRLWLQCGQLTWTGNSARSASVGRNPCSTESSSASDGCCYGEKRTAERKIPGAIYKAATGGRAGGTAILRGKHIGATTGRSFMEN